MKAVFHKKFQRFIRKIKDQILIKKIKSEVDLIIEHPKQGKLLEHPFRKYHIFSIGFLYKKNSYRIAYTIGDDEIVFLLIDSRENFYKKLTRSI